MFRVSALVALALTAVVFVVALSVGIGDLPISITTTFLAISNKLGWTTAELNRIHEAVIWDYRLSRALVAAFCGAGLAISGAIMQSLLRNPLAEPYVLGISAGASTGAVGIVILGFGSGAVPSRPALSPGPSPPSSSSPCCPTARAAGPTAPFWLALLHPSSSTPQPPMS